jgi:hypothetical protein
METLEAVLNDAANGDQHFDSDIYVDNNIICRAGTLSTTDLDITSAANLDVVETTLTDDDTKIPSSGAIIDYHSCAHLSCTTSPSIKNLFGDSHLTHWDTTVFNNGCTVATGGGSTSNYIQVLATGIYGIHANVLIGTAESSFCTSTLYKNGTWDASTLHNTGGTIISQSYHRYPTTASQYKWMTTLASLAANDKVSLGLECGTSGTQHRATGTNELSLWRIR